MAPRASPAVVLTALLIAGTGTVRAGPITRLWEAHVASDTATVTLNRFSAHQTLSFPVAWLQIRDGTIEEDPSAPREEGTLPRLRTRPTAVMVAVSPAGEILTPRPVTYTQRDAAHNSSAWTTSARTTSARRRIGSQCCRSSRR